VPSTTAIVKKWPARVLQASERQFGSILGDFGEEKCVDGGKI